MEKFYSMIDELIGAPPKERAAGERRIRDAFEVDRAVLALDMSSFSFSVRRSGIVSHLCQIRRMQRLVAPLIAAWHGEMVKCEADNVLAVFADPRHAVEASVAINRQLAEPGESPAHASELTVAIGIDCGKVLLIPGKDCFGDAVNIACKLGEDIARPQEILVTDNVKQMLGRLKDLRTERQTIAISGLELVAHKVLYERA